MQTLSDKLKILLEAENTNALIEFQGSNHQWYSCSVGDFIVSYFHSEVRLIIDPFKEQKEAFAKGEQIQISNHYSDGNPNDFPETWEDCVPQWAPNRKYRVKPNPVDLDASDFTIHTVIRNHKSQTNIKWIKIVSVTDEGIKIHRTNSERSIYSFKELHINGWEMSENGVNWKPCHK